MWPDWWFAAIWATSYSLWQEFDLAQTTQNFWATFEKGSKCNNFLLKTTLAIFGQLFPQALGNVFRRLWATFYLKILVTLGEFWILNSHWIEIEKWSDCLVNNAHASKKSSIRSAATIAHWIRLLTPPCGPGFEYQALD